MLLNQHLVFVFYLNLLQLACDVLWNKDNLVYNQLFNHLLEQMQSFECYHMSFDHFFTKQITSCLCSFFNRFSWSSFKCICSRLFSMTKKFLVVFTTNVFTNKSTYTFSKEQTSTAFYKYSIFRINLIARNFLHFN